MLFCKHKRGKVLRYGQMEKGKVKILFKCADCGREIKKSVDKEKLHNLQFVNA